MYEYTDVIIIRYRFYHFLIIINSIVQNKGAVGRSYQVEATFQFSLWLNNANWFLISVLECQALLFVIPIIVSIRKK